MNKLAAMLRVANALDAEHLQKVRDIRLLRRRGDLDPRTRGHRRRDDGADGRHGAGRPVRRDLRPPDADPAGGSERVTERTRTTAQFSSTASCRGSRSTSASSRRPRTRPCRCSSASSSRPSRPRTSTNSSWSASPASCATSRTARRRRIPPASPRAQQLPLIRDRARALMPALRRFVDADLRPALAAQGVSIVAWAEVPAPEQARLTRVLPRCGAARADAARHRRLAAVPAARVAEPESRAPARAGAGRGRAAPAARRRRPRSSAGDRPGAAGPGASGARRRWACR